ncbi:NAD(P)H-hydrate dehydratase [Desulfatirhabdium butyrativorans]|uniref:NAD(P)H-hydrate dehydratase n=1 Tax=Desulfatirhabdium butyrativorans TaxID=340467 RepID=UPI0004238E02|nr:NAD(P)H-hydrate dehydratase [Desulfatirhabdium butyrativorans]
MPWLIVGTVPQEDFPLVHGEARLDGDQLVIGNHRIPVVRGTPALIAAVILARSMTGTQTVDVLLAGDTGKGQGSALIYRYFERMDRSRYSGITFHYLQPDLDGHNRVWMALDADGAARPLLVADAGFMYVAKMSGYAESYDLFTPDAGELAFLADEKAPHPFYTRGFLLQDDAQVPELIQKAYQHHNAAKHLLIKGKTDTVVANGRIVVQISEPSVPVLEPIGGTGDTVTGIATALLAEGCDMVDACRTAALVNRVMGQLAAPDPASSIAALLRFLPRALISGRVASTRSEFFPNTRRR